MEAYQLDEKGFFVGMVECQKHPINKGQFLLPKNATFVPKPEDCNFFDFDSKTWTLNEYEEMNTNSSIQLIIEGEPSKDSIKEVISQLLRML